MAQTVKGRTVKSETVQNDHEVVDGRLLTNPGAGFDVGNITLASLGTSPSVVRRGEGGKIRLTVTVGTGAPAIAGNNIQIAIAGGTAPRKVFMAAPPGSPGWHIDTVTASTINIGTKAAPGVSTVHEIELIILF